MARYQERAARAEQELRELKAKAQPVERLLAHSVLITASLNILMKHDLLGEFSKEVSRLETISDPAKDPPLQGPKQHGWPVGTKICNCVTGEAEPQPCHCAAGPELPNGHRESPQGEQT